MPALLRATEADAARGMGSFQATLQCLQHVEVERSRPEGGTSAGIVTGRVLWDARESCDPGGSRRYRLSFGLRALPRQ